MQYTINEFNERSRNARTFKITAKDLAECRKKVIQKGRSGYQYEVFDSRGYFKGTLCHYGKNVCAYWMVYTEDSGDDSKDLWINPVNGRSKR